MLSWMHLCALTSWSCHRSYINQKHSYVLSKEDTAHSSLPYDHEQLPCITFRTRYCILCPSSQWLQTVAVWLTQPMGKLTTMMEQHLDIRPPTVVTQATTWWEIALAHVKLQEIGLGVHLSVKVCLLGECMFCLVIWLNIYIHDMWMYVINGVQREMFEGENFRKLLENWGFPGKNFCGVLTDATNCATEFLQRKLSQIATKPWNLWKFPPSKVSCSTVSSIYMK